jgi:hypothetical protein
VLSNPLRYTDPEGHGVLNGTNFTTSNIWQNVTALYPKRSLTAVFDRGGHSPKLFQQVLAADFDLTYRIRFNRSVPQDRTGNDLLG